MAKLSKDYNLAVLYPDIAKEWHPTKNGDLTPFDITPGSEKKVWWICSKNHEWEAQIYPRTNKGYGCKNCVQSKPKPGNDLQTKSPQIAKEWHPTKNGDLKPSDVSCSSGKKVWWQCKNYNKHIWETSVDNRYSKGSGCPHCSIGTSKPELYIFCELSSIFNKVYHRKIVDKIEIDIFIEDIGLAIEYDGVYFHKNKMKQDKIKKSTLEKKGFKTLSIREIPLKKISFNDILVNPTDTKYNKFLKVISYIKSNEKINKDHKNAIKNYIKNGKQVNEKLYNNLLSYLPGPTIGKDLKSKYPKVAKEWHPTKNGNLKPDHVFPYSNERAWWICSKNHEWEAKIDYRTKKKTGCAICKVNRPKVSKDYNLAVLYPDIAKEWHPTKNGDIKPEEISPYSNIKFWWICSKNHEWNTMVATRTKQDTHCVVCNQGRAGYKKSK